MKFCYYMVSDQVGILICFQIGIPYQNKYFLQQSCIVNFVNTSFLNNFEVPAVFLSNKPIILPNYGLSYNP